MWSSACFSNSCPIQPHKKDHKFLEGICFVLTFVIQSWMNNLWLHFFKNEKESVISFFSIIALHPKVLDCRYV